MLLKACVALFLTLAVHSILAAPKVPKARIGTKRVFDNPWEDVNGETYNVITEVIKKKDKCSLQTTVTGNGVGDVFQLPCSSRGVVTVATSELLIYGKPGDDSFSIFSDRPSTMIVFKDGRCSGRVYKTEKKKTFPEITDMKNEDCKKVQELINSIVEKQSKYLRDVDKLINESENK